MGFGKNVSCCSTKLDFKWNFLILELAVRVALTAAVVVTTITADPFVRVVPPSEWPQYSYPSKAQTFPELESALICAGAGTATLLLWLCVLRWGKKWNAKQLIQETIYVCLSAWLSMVCVFMVVELVKVMYGGLRPDYLSRCFGNDPTKWPATIPPIPECTATKKSELKDGRKSFPSGHAAMVWSVFSWMALYCYSRLCLLKNTGGLRIALPFVLLLFPIAVSISRTSDYRHFLVDILCGSFIGLVITAVVFAFYHPLYLRPVDIESSVHFCHPVELETGTSWKKEERKTSNAKTREPEALRDPSRGPRVQDDFHV